MKSVEDLLAWQLGDDLRRAVKDLASRESVQRDFRFVSQLQDSASGVTRNISEGFGRIRPRDFARFLLYSRGSLLELQDHLTEGVVRGHWRDPDVQHARVLCRRAKGALDGLIRYLLSPAAERADWTRRSATRNPARAVDDKD